MFVHEKPDGFKEEKTTAKNGDVIFYGLTVGKHTFYEKSAPDGYVVNTNKIVVTVKSDGSMSINKNEWQESDTNGEIIYVGTTNTGVDSDIVSGYIVSVEDKPAPFDLHVNNINNHNFALQGAEFTLYSDAACKTKVASQTSDSAGNLTFKDLIPYKTYYMKETKAPVGYRIPVNADGSDIVWSIRVESSPVDGVFNYIVNGKTYTDKSTGTFTVSGTVADRVVNMSVVNEVGMKLPNTGSNWMIILVTAGVLLMAGTLVVSRMQKKKEIK